MERKRAFRSGVVLLELMASILIFALAGAVCVQVLMKADALATRAQNLSDGVNIVSSAAEILRSADSEAEAMECLSKAWPQAAVDGNVQIPMEQGILEIQSQNRNGLICYRISWLVAGESLYELELLRSVQEGNP